MKNDEICLNGDIVGRREASVPVMDRGFLYGEGFFETTRVCRGVPFRLGEHLERMRAACQKADWDWSPDGKEIRGDAERLIERKGISDGYLRVTVSGGVDVSGGGDLRPAVMIDARRMELNPIDDASSMRLVRAPWRRNETSPFAAMKSLSYQENKLAMRLAARMGGDEVYFLNTKGNLAEGAISNLFWVSGRHVYTPAESQGLLPGIGRRVVLEVCEEEGIPTTCGAFSEKALLEAEEVFCTNSLRGVIPVEDILHPHRITVPGRDVTERVQSLTATRIKQECGS
ncbi:MAG: aminotransferase class IV [Planctomycetota bacterium]